MRSVTLECIGLLSRFKDSSEQCEVDCLEAASVKCLYRLGVSCRKGCLLLLVLVLSFAGFTGLM